MADYTLKLDPVTRDLLFDANDIMETIEGDDASVQNVNVNLNTWKGEFLLDETHGTDYERILGKFRREVLPNETEEVLRDGVLQEPKVSIINSIDATLSDKRVLNASITGELASESDFDTEVSQNGESE